MVKLEWIEHIVHGEVHIKFSCSPKLKVLKMGFVRNVSDCIAQCPIHERHSEWGAEYLLCNFRITMNLASFFV